MPWLRSLNETLIKPAEPASDPNTGAELSNTEERGVVPEIIRSRRRNQNFGSGLPDISERVLEPNILTLNKPSRNRVM